MIKRPKQFTAILLAMLILCVAGAQLNVADKDERDKKAALVFLSQLKEETGSAPLMLRHALTEHYAFSSPQAVGYESITDKGLLNVFAKYRQCTKLIGAGETKRGLAILQDIEESHKEDPIVLCVLAENELNHTRFLKSKLLFNRALKRHPLMPRAHIGLAKVAMLEGNHELMLEHCSMVLLLEERNSPLASRVISLLNEELGNK